MVAWTREDPRGGEKRAQVVGRQQRRRQERRTVGGEGSRVKAGRELVCAVDKG
jgi:hypothetical protein